MLTRLHLHLIFFYLFFFNFFFHFFSYFFFVVFSPGILCLLHLFSTKINTPNQKINKNFIFQISILFSFVSHFSYACTLYYAFILFLFLFSQFFFLFFLICNFFVVFSPTIHVFCTYNPTKKHILQKNKQKFHLSIFYFFLTLILFFIR